MPTEDGNVVSDSDESISSASKDKKKTIWNLSDFDSNDSNSVDSYDSNESYRSNDIDYTQAEGTQLKPYQQGPLC